MKTYGTGHGDTTRGRGRYICVSSMPAWFTYCAPGQPGLHRDALSQKTNKKKWEADEANNKTPANTREPKVAKLAGAWLEDWELVREKKLGARCF